jgi:hypothetical protein
VDELNRQQVSLRFVARLCSWSGGYASMVGGAHGRVGTCGREGIQPSGRLCFVVGRLRFMVGGYACGPAATLRGPAATLRGQVVRFMVGRNMLRGQAAMLRGRATQKAPRLPQPSPTCRTCLPLQRQLGLIIAAIDERPDTVGSLPTPRPVNDRGAIYLARNAWRSRRGC